jgi:hypothetical protein
MNGYCLVFMSLWPIIMGSESDDWIYWCHHLHNRLQQLTISDCLKLPPFCWTTTVFFSSLVLWLTWFRFTNDLVLGSPFYCNCLRLLWFLSGRPLIQHCSILGDVCCLFVSMDMPVGFTAMISFLRVHNLRSCIHGHVCLTPSDGLCQESYLHGNVFASSSPRNGLHLLSYRDCFPICI